MALEIKTWWPRLLAEMERTLASDAHLAAGRQVFLRCQGQLRASDAFAETLTEADFEALLGELLPPAGREIYAEHGSADGAFSSPSGGRFRFNAYRCASGSTLALRRLEDRFRTLEDLGLPQTLARWGQLNDGLILVAGPTGSGKSTTLATLLDIINTERELHVITIEDPIEYLHPCKRSLVDQRQIGLHATDFQSALVASLRQDPDVILIGEIRERTTIRTALTAAETGHLVFATVHAPDPAGALQRIVSVFPADEQPGILRQLALNLKGILAQHLVRADGPQASAASTKARPRVLLSELLQVTPAVANLIANARFNQIQSCMETGQGQGMQTLESSLLHWVQSGHLSETSALTLTSRPNLLRQRLGRGTSENLSGRRTV